MAKPMIFPDGFVISIAAVKTRGSIRRVKEFLDGIREVSPHAEPILVISLTAILGLLIGSIRIRGIKLGVAGMLFSGLLLGHLGLTLDPHLMSFLKEFGLALFVFTVGFQLGPGFFNSLKKDGLKLNALAVLIVLGGAAVAFRVRGVVFSSWDPGVLAGVFSGCHHQHAVARCRAAGDGRRRKRGLRQPARRWPTPSPIPSACSASSSSSS